MNDVPPFYQGKVSKFPTPGIVQQKPGVVYVKPDCEPVDFLKAVMKDKSVSMDWRIDAAKALLPFCHSIKPIKRK